LKELKLLNPKFYEELPLNVCIGYDFQILVIIKIAYIKIELPLNFGIRGVPKCVCDREKIYDAYDKIYHKE
jgi:hypothetical protein